MGLEHSSIFIIKPEGYDRRESIRRFIRRHSQLEIVDAKSAMLDQTDVENIFTDDFNTPLARAIASHVVGRTVEIGLVSVEPDSELDVTRELLGVCGEHFDPALCAQNTVRFQYGLNECADYGGVKYHLNAIHKASANEREGATRWCIERFFTI